MRTITIYVTDPLYAKLVAVAAKCSGHDKPTQDQIDNTLALLAHAALITAHAQVSKPEPVTKPLPPLGVGAPPEGALAGPTHNLAAAQPTPAHV